MKKAFSMIELIAVIVIMGVLAGIAIPKLIANKKSAEIALFKNDISQVQTAIETYAADSYLMTGEKKYPEGLCQGGKKCLQLGGQGELFNGFGAKPIKEYAYAVAAGDEYYYIPITVESLWTVYANANSNALDKEVMVSGETAGWIKDLEKSYSQMQIYKYNNANRTYDPLLQKHNGQWTDVEDKEATGSDDAINNIINDATMGIYAIGRIKDIRKDKGKEIYVIYPLLYNNVIGKLMCDHNTKQLPIAGTTVLETRPCTEIGL